MKKQQNRDFRINNHSVLEKNVKYKNKQRKIIFQSFRHSNSRNSSRKSSNKDPYSDYEDNHNEELSPIQDRFITLESRREKI